MTDLTNVPGPSSPLKGNSGLVITVVVIGVALAVVKPWGGPPAAPPATPAPEPTAVVATVAPSAAIREAFDFGVFEGFEPKPAWEVWPAGREISLGFAMKVDADNARPSPTVTPPSNPSAAPTVRPTASPTPRASAAAPVGPPVWSNTIAISPATTLTVVAVNMPLSYRIPSVELTRLDANGVRTMVPVVLLPSPWPDHFIVVGIDDGSGRGAVAAWPAGEYALDLHIEPTGWTSTIHVEVQEPSASASPPETPTP